MTDLEKKKTGGLPATNETNPFEEYGNAATARGGIEGTLLNFNKGDYLAGQEKEEVPLGTAFQALIDKLMTGWVCWQDGIPVDKENMGLVAERFVPPRRKELGDLDKTLWERDPNGQEQDPWQLTNYLPMRRIDNGEIYTFATNTKGGLAAIGELCKVYGKEMRRRPDQDPVIALDASSYQHRERSIGRVHVPVLNKIVDWVDKDGGDSSGGNGSNEPPQSPPSDTKKPTTTSSATKPAAKPRF
jgi:hypothetical protein